MMCIPLICLIFSFLYSKAPIFTIFVTPLIPIKTCPNQMKILIDLQLKLLWWIYSILEANEPKKWRRKLIWTNSKHHLTVMGNLCWFSNFMVVKSQKICQRIGSATKDSGVSDQGWRMAMETNDNEGDQIMDLHQTIFLLQTRAELHENQGRHEFLKSLFYILKNILVFLYRPPLKF